MVQYQRNTTDSSPLMLPIIVSASASINVVVVWMVGIRCDVLRHGRKYPDIKEYYQRPNVFHVTRLVTTFV